ncbi:MAG: beta-ketoacyl-ACP synthase [Myxococcales bacterium]|nr:beta-ketoacyl-ACP synthase [Myxococcales bacterium]
MGSPSLLPITGYCVCNALGPHRDAIVERLRTGERGLGEAPFPLPFPTVAGVVRSELPELPAALARWSNRPTRIAKQLVDQLEPALARTRARWRPSRIGIVLGTSTSGADATEHAYAHFLQQGALPEGYDFRKQHTFGALVDVLARLTGIEGPAWVVSTTCTSSAKPFGSARRLIAADVLDAVLVGGIDTLCAMTLCGFHALGALSARPCKPFSGERDGINIGEGGALMIIERSGDGLAVLEAVGESSDAYHISAPHPEGLGARLAMQRALDEAGLRPDDVDHINAHGTGTPLNDAAEGKAITAVFGDQIPVTSTKGYTGHTLGGAGAIEAAIAVMCLEEGLVPPSPGVDPQDPKISIHVAREAIHRPLRRVLSNSFAFGGSNVSVLVRSA